jgi:hypothetical protein
MFWRLFSRIALAIALMTLGYVPMRAEDLKSAKHSSRTDQIKSLLEQLADEARGSEDLYFAVKAEYQAAALLWPYDRDGARSIYRRAIESISNRLALEPIPGSVSANQGSLQQLRVELMNQIADRDPELVEQAAKAFAFSRPLGQSDSYPQEPLYQAPGSIAPPNSARRDLLIEMAIQLVERDPRRAITVAQLSFADGISPGLGRLLMTLRAVDPALADLLFSSSVYLLERSDTPDVASLHTLASYLVSSPAPSANDSAGRSIVGRFLMLALTRVSWCAEQSVLESRRGPGDGALVAGDGVAGAYFIGRQLSGLVARYLPERLSELLADVAVLGQSSVFDRPADSNPVFPVSQKSLSDPADLEAQTGAVQSESERDALHARAAFGWLNAGNVSQAQDATSRISDPEVRDRVLVQIVRRLTSEGRIEEAIATSNRIERDTIRVPALIKLARALLVAKDRVRATELLGEAEKEAFKESPSFARAQELLTIVASFLSFDSLRAFEVMQGAVKAINDIPIVSRPQTAPAESSRAGNAAAKGGPGLPFDLNFEGTLAILARNDYDNALSLAKQISGKDVSVVAQLAVCRGALAAELNPTDSPSHSSEHE